MREFYYWHGKLVRLICHSPFKKGIKRNAFVDCGNGYKVVVPWRSLRVKP